MVKVGGVSDGPAVLESIKNLVQGDLVDMSRLPNVCDYDQVRDVSARGSLQIMTYTRLDLQTYRCHGPPDIREDPDRDSRGQSNFLKRQARARMG